MFEQLEGVLIVGVVFFSVMAVIKILSDNKIRKMLIEKGMVNEKLQYLFAGKMDVTAPASLKWGMVLIGIGLAFLIGQLVPSLKEEITIALIFIFGGIGLLLYYFIAKKWSKKA